MLISAEGIDKNQLEPGQESMGDPTVLSPSSFLRYPWPKPTGVLEHYRERVTNSIFRVFSFWPHP